jgi:predicted dinucleotide-binding enzyme
MTTIGIIGSGQVGQNIAKAAIANGYDVVLSNNQGPGSLTGVVKGLGRHASAATPAEAATRGDFAVVAIPIATVDQVPVEPLEGKVVICTINYFPERLGHIREIDDGEPLPPDYYKHTCPRAGGARLQHDRRGGHVRRRPPR